MLWLFLLERRRQVSLYYPPPSEMALFSFSEPRNRGGLAWQPSPANTFVDGAVCGGRIFKGVSWRDFARSFRQIVVAYDRPNLTARMTGVHHRQK